MAEQYQLLYYKIMHIDQGKQLNESFCIIESQLLGKGSTGNVYLGFERNNPQNRVAIKAINLIEIDNEVTRYLLSCEIAALSNLGKLENTGHDSVVKLHDIVIKDHYIYLIMEHLQGGTLADYMKKYPNGLPQDEAVSIFKQILEGYQYICSKQIVHRDLKPDNILFKTNPLNSKKIAIIDFGYCEMESVPNKPQMYYNVGSPKYMSPQAYKENKYSQKSDVWAMGVIFYEMLVGKTCDQGLSMQTYLQMLQKQGVPLPIKMNHFHKHILCLMLSINFHSRRQCSQILQQFQIYHVNLFHQKSEVIFLRKSVEDSQLRLSSQQTMDVERVNRNSGMFQSLIIQPNSQQKESFIEEKRSLENEFTKLKAPKIQINTATWHQQKQSNVFSNISQITEKIQNAQFNSARQIIHKKQITPQIGNQFAFPKFEIPNNLIPAHNIQEVQPPMLTQSCLIPVHIRPPSPQKMITMSSHLSTHSNIIQPNYYSNVPGNSNMNVRTDNRLSYRNTLPSDYHKNDRINFNIVPNGNQINISKNQQYPLQSSLLQPPQHQPQPLHQPHSHPHQQYQNQNQAQYYQQPKQQRFYTTPNEANLKNNQRANWTQNIPRQQRIEIESNHKNNYYHSPEKQLITVASKVQYFTEKKLGNQQNFSKVQNSQTPRTIINLRPAFGNMQAKAGFNRIQPHFGHVQFRNTMPQPQHLNLIAQGYGC